MKQLVKLIEEYLYEDSSNENILDDIVKIIKNNPENVLSLIKDKTLNSEIRGNAVRIYVEFYSGNNPNLSNLLMQLTDIIRHDNDTIVTAGIIYGFINYIEDSEIYRKFSLLDS